MIARPRHQDAEPASWGDAIGSVAILAAVLAWVYVACVWAQ